MFQGTYHLHAWRMDYTSVKAINKQTERWTNTAWVASHLQTLTEIKTCRICLQQPSYLTSDKYAVTFVLLKCEDWGRRCGTAG